MSVQTPDLHVPNLRSRITLGLRVVERRLLDAVSPSRDLADRLTRHLMVAGDGRMRPSLTPVYAQLGEPERGLDEQVITTATTVELTHLASLYHDDVVDLAPTCHGVPSAQHLWSNNRVILAGDILFVRASLLATSLGPEMVTHRARTFERPCGGQLNETPGPANGTDRVDFYLRILMNKAGSLVFTAASFDALLSNTGQLMADVMSDFDGEVGVAFQIADDVFDLASSGEQSGKTPGIDLREGADTLPVLLLYHREAAGTIDEVGTHTLREPTGDLSSDEVLASVAEQLHSRDVLEETRRLMRTWANDTVAMLAPLPKDRAKTALETFASLMVDRLV